MASVRAGRPPAPPGAVQALKIGVAVFYRREQGRGHRVTIEYYPRTGGDYFDFCYPDDYTHTPLGHDVRGTLRRVPRRPRG